MPAGRAADVEYGALALVGGAEEEVLPAGVDVDSLGDTLCLVIHPVAVDSRVAVVDSRVDQADPATGVRDQERVVVSLAVVVGRDTVILNYWGVGPVLAMSVGNTDEVQNEQRNTTKQIYRLLF